MSAPETEPLAETQGARVMHAQTYSGSAACSRRKASDRIMLVPTDAALLCPKCRELMQSDHRRA